jgi:hypothetical protein
VDFDSTMRRFESSRPSQHLANEIRAFESAGFSLQTPSAADFRTPVSDADQHIGITLSGRCLGAGQISRGSRAAPERLVPSSAGAFAGPNR